MRRSTLLMCALLTIATSGCKQINEQVQKIKDKIAAARQRSKPVQPAPTTPQPVPSQDVAATPPASPPPKRPARQAPPAPLPPRGAPDQAPHTGTIRPGVGEREAVNLVGAPLAGQHQGDVTYPYQRNGRGITS